MNDKLYTQLCAIPVVQTIVGGASALKNFALLFRDLVFMALNWKGPEAYNKDCDKQAKDWAQKKWSIETLKPVKVDPEEHACECVRGFVSAIPVIGTIFNLCILGITAVTEGEAEASKDMNEFFSSLKLTSIPKACEILSLTEEEAQDPKKVKDAYDSKMNQANEKYRSACDAHAASIANGPNASRISKTPVPYEREETMYKEAYDLLMAQCPDSHQGDV